MNPPRKTTGLFLTPRAPYGRRLTDRAQHHHMRASEDRKPRAVGQEAMDQFKRQADLAGNMAASNVPGSLKPTGEIPGAGQTDKNGVPPGLQSRISPQRAGEITDPSRQPLPSPKIPRMTNQMFPLDPKQQPLPAQTLPGQAGSGVLRPATTGQPMPDDALGKTSRTLPGAEHMNGLDLGPVTIGVDGESVGQGGFGLKFTPKVWQTPKKERP